ncbi:MAG: N-acetylmuramoyl-L-alanine amidase [Thermodesulfobacteriota bacterium]|nr:N-acetylmuramoyl-L-alanine amidase [Thermodesulfobacteriota bacterium]
MNKKNVIYFLVVLFVIVNDSCSLKKIEPVYPLFEYSYLDTSCLKGKTFIIDPGHGGSFRGAKGKIGINESEINLGVGLYLWGMLKAGGANVYLTRQIDADFITDFEKPLISDLRFRVDLCRKRKCDYFISIHHNSDIRNRRKNSTEIYYKMTDPGPSYELARSIATYFKNYFFSQDVRVLPGNYYVLRENPAPAILGEAAYLSNLSSEKKLSLQGYIRKEAEIYFLGILNYLQKKVPVIFDLSPKNIIRDSQPEISAYIRDEDGKGTIDEGSVLLYLDDSPVLAKYHPESGLISYTPPKPLKNGRHYFKIYGKNLMGNSAFPESATFTVSLLPFKMEVKPEFSVLPPIDGAFTRISFSVKDKNYMPVIDGTAIDLKSRSGQLKPEKIYTKNGNAFSYFYPFSKKEKAVITAFCNDIYAETCIEFSESRRNYIVLEITDHQGMPLNKAEIILKNGDKANSDKNGFIFFSGVSPEVLRGNILKSGYFPCEITLPFNGCGFKRKKVKLKPREGGFLINRKIALDFNNKEENFNVNLRPLICELKTLLKEAGVDVFLSGENLDHYNIKQRILKTNKSLSCICISLRYAGKRPEIGYYYKSIKGEKLAAYISNSINTIKRINSSIKESTEPIILFTSMPAIVIGFPYNRGYLKDDALAIYKGIVEFFKEEDCR